MSLDPAMVSDIAAELGIDPAFVEKDWYSVQVLKTISAHQSDTVATIFSGGTCLSKAHGLLKRFSEDLDFRCRYEANDSENQKRKIRSVYRKGIISAIQTIEFIRLDEDQVSVASNYIKFPLGYPQQYAEHSALRPNLEIEFSFTQPRLEPELRSVQSLVSQFTGSAPETEILCLSPIETGADKLSALTWRVLKRDRSSIKDDPAMIRHLHDLCALDSIIDANHELFIETALLSFEEDQRTGNRSTDSEFCESVQSALTMLRGDDEYAQEYKQFVDAMSYADDDENISFETAVSTLEKLIVLFE